MAGVREEISKRLNEVFSLTHLEIRDDSDRHRGHSGWKPSGETHFHIILSSPEFALMTRLEQHRSVHRALSPEPLGSVHSLTLQINSN